MYRYISYPQRISSIEYISAGPLSIINHSKNVLSSCEPHSPFRQPWFIQAFRLTQPLFFHHLNLLRFSEPPLSFWECKGNCCNNPFQISREKNFLFSLSNSLLPICQSCPCAPCKRAPKVPLPFHHTNFFATIFSTFCQLLTTQPFILIYPSIPAFYSVC